MPPRRDARGRVVAAAPDADADADAGRIVVALVRGLHGLNGAVRVEVLTDRPEDRFAAGSVLHPEGSSDVLTVVTGAPVEDGPGWRLRFGEVPDRTAAEPLRDVYLEAAVDRAAALGEGEFFWHEVVGAAVLDLDGRELGRVRDVYRAGEAEVYVVGGGPPGEFDLPAVSAFVLEFDPRGGRIVVDAAALALDEIAPRGERPRRRDRRGRPGRGPGPEGGAGGAAGDRGAAGDAGAAADGGAGGGEGSAGAGGAGGVEGGGA
jgi:16S rRNA processing protein RimM